MNGYLVRDRIRGDDRPWRLGIVAVSLLVAVVPGITLVLPIGAINGVRLASLDVAVIKLDQRLFDRSTVEKEPELDSQRPSESTSTSFRVDFLANSSLYLRALRRNIS